MAKQRLAEDNIRLIQQGCELIASVDDETYTHTFEELYSFGIGSHLRHLYDHYELFLAGLPTGRIDFDKRERDPRFETDRTYALDQWRRVIEQLAEIGGETAGQELSIKIDGGGDPENDWSRTTVKRELSYLAMHDVHHYAIIAFMLHLLEKPTPDGFGVAPSTLRYQASG